MTTNTQSRCPFEHLNNPELETKQIAETVELTVKLLDKRYPPPAQILRGVHPKAHGCVTGTFTINADIAPELQVGLFAEPGKQFDAFLRFSNAAALVGPDIDDTGKHGSRGMAIKVLAVGGEVITDDNGAHNQDFLMINQPVFAFANSKDYLRLDKVLDQQDDKADGFFAPLQLENPAITEEERRRILAYIEAEDITEEDIQRIKDSFKIIGEIQATPVANPLGVQYFSAAPFLFGSDRVMKFSAKPCSEVPPTDIPQPPTDNYLREALITAVNSNDDLHFDFMVQVRSDSDDFGKDNESIENASSLWDEANYPFIKVARITIPTPQADITTKVNRAHCEQLAFTPWHALVEHQPIGSINRLRKSVYQASSEHRLKQKDFFVQCLENFFKFLFG